MSIGKSDPDLDPDLARAALFAVPWNPLLYAVYCVTKPSRKSSISDLYLATVLVAV